MTATGIETTIGQPVEALDTPALWVDIDALDHNIATMAGLLRSRGLDWRPHVKASKAPALARRLVAGGAVGVTCAKVSEAEVLADGGITDILIANEIVGPLKIARLVALAARATVCVAVDDAENLRQIAAAAEASGVTVDVLVDINVGMNRCGVTPAQAPALARLATDLPGVALRGLMGYEGHVMGMQADDKEAGSGQAADTLRQAIDALRSAGLEPQVVSGGGTGNYWIASALGSLTELQAGGGVLLDQTYEERMKVPGHRQALFLMAQVISTASPGRAIADAGWKASGMHTGLPRVVSPPGLAVRALNAEHTILDRAEGTDVTLGDRVTMVPHYSDSTALLHHQMYAVRDGRVVEVWPIAAAGMLQ
ncbi:MAG: alanine racemase [Chloroflexi bacterium]|nr:alanine racemase [Chloroflexota bacterium]